MPRERLRLQYPRLDAATPVRLSDLSIREREAPVIDKWLPRHSLMLIVAASAILWATLIAAVAAIIRALS